MPFNPFDGAKWSRIKHTIESNLLLIGNSSFQKPSLWKNAPYFSIHNEITIKKFFLQCFYVALKKKKGETVKILMWLYALKKKTKKRAEYAVIL